MSYRSSPKVESTAHLVCILCLVTVSTSSQICAASFLDHDRNGNAISVSAATESLPVIMAQPANTLAPAQEGAGMSVVVSSGSPVTFEWRRSPGGDAVSGATGDSLFFPNLAPADEGSYYVVVTNATGSVTSSTATLFVDQNGNQLPDTWELAHFGDLFQTVTGDYDADGVNNGDEYRAGTNPAINPNVASINYWKASSGSFSTASNWSLNKVPGAGDTAVINQGTFTTPSTVAATVVVNAPYRPKINTTIKASGRWRFTGPFEPANNTTFQVVGSGANVTIEGSTKLGDSSVFVSGGATITLNEVDYFIHPGKYTVKWRVTGKGSTLKFPNLRGLSGTDISSKNLYLESTSGGILSLPALQSIQVPTDDDTGTDGGVRLYAYGSGVISAPLLTSFKDNTNQAGSSLRAYSSGKIDAPNLLSLSGVSIDLNEESNPARFTTLINPRTIVFNSGSGVARASQLKSITGNATLLIDNRASLNFSSLSSVGNLTEIRVDGRAKAFFGAVRGFDFPTGYKGNFTWRVSDASSELGFPQLATITGPANPGGHLYLRAEGSGKMLFEKLSSIIKPGDGDKSANSGVHLLVSSLAQISAPKLVTFSDKDTMPGSEISATEGGVFTAPSLLAPKGASINLNEASDPFRFTSLTNARTVVFHSGSGLKKSSKLTAVFGFTKLTVDNKVNVTFNSLVSVNNLTEIAVKGGAKVDFSALKEFSFPKGYKGSISWMATGAESVLASDRLVSIVGPAIPGSRFYVRAERVGKVSFGVLNSITKRSDGDKISNSGVHVIAGSSALISAPKLVKFSDIDPFPGSELTAIGLGRLEANLLLAPVGASINLNEASNPFRFTSLTNARKIVFHSGTGVQKESRLAAIHGPATLTVDDDVNMSFGRLTSIANLSIISVNGKSRVSFGAITQYAFPLSSGQNVLWKASDSGTIMTFPKLRSIVGPKSSNRVLAIQAVQGGEIRFPVLATISKESDDGSSRNSGIQIVAAGSGVLVAPSLRLFSDKDQDSTSKLIQGSGSVIKLGSLAQSAVHGVLVSGINLPEKLPKAYGLIAMLRKELIPSAGRDGIMGFPESRSEIVWEDGLRHLQIRVRYTTGIREPVVEVSSNLVDWSSGPKHTTVIRRTENSLVVRDKMPLNNFKKRYIRVKP